MNSSDGSDDLCHTRTVLLTALALSIGTRVNRYEIRSHLGAGGMGEVYLAHDNQLNRPVALKLLPLDVSSDPDRLRRFGQEAKAASALNHPNIVTIHEIGTSEAGSFIAMEFVQGKTLRALGKSSLPIESIADLIRQVAKALNVAHAVGIVHRDIKPENIMVRDDGYVKVLDFGLARLVRGGAALAEAETLSMGVDATAPGLIMGTLRYMSPEQTRGEPVSTPTDIFSLGILFYELIAGHHPFQSDSQIGVMHAIMSQEVVAPSRLNPAIPTHLEGLILQMLQKDPALRPTAGEVDAALSKATSINEPAIRVIAGKRKTVGHNGERAELQKSFSAVVNGRGLMFCVAGEPGIGKTTFVEDFLADLRKQGLSCLVARGRCSERLAGGDAYLPFLEALESLFHVSGSQAILNMMKLLAPTWYVQVGPSSNDSSANRASTELRTASQEWMKRELAVFMHELARQQPLVLFLDDLHWADVSTVELLAHLVDRLEAQRILIIATYRSAELQLSKHPFLQIKLGLQARGICRELPLNFLSREDITDYLHLEFPENTFPDELTTLIHDKTEGSPLFMVDLVGYLRDRKFISQEDAGWRLAQTVPDIEKDLPESVRSMIERKIAQLTGDEKRLLTAASVQGYEFDSAVLAGVLGSEADQIEEQLEALERIHGFVRLVEEKELPDLALNSRYQFVHVLYQNALYSAIRPTRKASMSTLVAKELIRHYQKDSSEIASELAFLFQTGRDFRSAANYFLLAGKNAARVYANQEAIRFYQAAAEMIEQQNRAQPSSVSEMHVVATDVYEELGKTLAISGKHEEAREAFAKALETAAGNLLDRCRIFRQIGGTWLAQRQVDKTVKAVDAAEEALKEYQGDRSEIWWHELIQVHLERMWVFYWRGEIRRLDELTNTTATIIEEHGSQIQRAKLIYMKMLYNLRRDRYSPNDETIKYAEAALAAIEGSDDVGAVTAIRFAAGFAFLWCGLLDRAEQQMTKTLQLAKRRGDRPNQVLCFTYLTIVYRKLGQLDKVIDYNAEALQASTAAGMPPYIAMAKANRAWVAWRHGDRSSVKTDAIAAIDSWQQQDKGRYAFQWAALWPLISVIISENQVSEALDYAQMLLGPHQQLLPPELSTLIEQGLAASKRDDLEQALVCLRDAVKLAEDLKYL